MKNDLTATRDMVKATVTMDDVCDRLGVKIPHDRKIPSIYRKEKTPSLHLYKADFFDYATGQGGDVIRFVMDHQGWGYRKALQWLSRSRDGLVRTRHDEKAVEVADLGDVWAELRATNSMPLHVYEWWDAYSMRKWGLRLRTIEEMGPLVVWYMGGWVLAAPHIHDGKVRGIKVRWGDSRKVSVPGSQYTHGLYETPRLRENLDRCYIVEGESDTWALTDHVTQLERYNIGVYGLPSGAHLWRDSWRSNLPDVVMLALDGDEAGKAATERIVGSLKTVGKRVYVLSPPGGRVAEALLAGHSALQWPAMQA